jgi:hypothetical protein
LVKFKVTVHGFRVQRFKVDNKSDPLIHEFCELPRQCPVTVEGKTRTLSITKKEEKNGKRTALPTFLSQRFDGFLGVICR